MSRKHYNKPRKKKDKPVLSMGVEPQIEVVKPAPLKHGGYTHPWGMTYYETTVYPRGSRV